MNAQLIKSNGFNPVKSKSLNRHKKMKANIEYLIMESPSIILMLIFVYLPMIGVILAFKDFKYDLGMIKSPWAGLDNFKFFFTSQDAWMVTRNTIFLNLLFIFTGLIFSVAFALMMYEIKRKYLVSTYQNVMILPSFLSWVVVGYMTYALLNPELGFINRTLQSLGIQTVSWYSEPAYWPLILITVSIWKGAGLSSIIYYSILLNINSEYYEAAKVDGATKWQMARYISIPFLIPAMTILTILAIGGIIRSDFGMFYNLTRNVASLYSTTYVIDTYVYNALRIQGDIGMSSAVGLYQSFVGFILIILTNMIVRKIDKENSIF